MNDINQIELSTKELETLKNVDREGCVNDKVMDVYPYDYLLRLDLLEHGYSAKYPYEPVLGDISIPMNVLKVSDLGRLFLARKRKEEGTSKKDRRRYWITTGIAIAALVKAFLPEIMAFLARLFSSG